MNVEREVVCKVESNPYSAKIVFGGRDDSGAVVFERTITTYGDEDEEGAVKTVQIKLGWHDPDRFRGLSCNYDPGDQTRPNLVKFLRLLSDELERGSAAPAKVLLEK